MTYRNLERFFVWGIYGLLAFVPFLPLFISKSLLFPYISGRNFAFRIIVEIAFVLWLGLIALSKKYRPELSLIVKAVLLFVGIVFLADLFGADFAKSFWSNYERMEGFLMIFHMALFFIITASVFREWEWKIFANLAILASLGVGGYAIYQKLGFAWSIQGGVRVDGTIGNPTYLAAYLLLIFFITCLSLWYSKKRWQKYIYGLIILFHLCVIYFSASRGVILGLFVGAIVFSVLVILLGRKDAISSLYKKFAYGFLGFVVIVPLLFFAIRKSDFVTKSPVLSRFASISLTERTTQSRFIIWGDIAVKGIMEHPILGWGQENFNLIFNKYYNAKLWPQEPWFDRSHNIIFDWLSNAGILGLASYGALFVGAFMILRRAHKHKKIDTMPVIILSTALVSYLFQNLFVFDNFNTYFLFFGFLAYIHSIESNPSEINEAHHPHSLSRSLIVTTVATLSMIFILYVWNIRPLQQNLALIRTLQFAGTGKDPKELNDLFKNILAHHAELGDDEVLEQYAQFASQIAGVSQVPEGTRVAILKDAIAAMEKQVQENSDDIRYMLFLTSTGYMRAAVFDGQYIPKAEQEYLKIIQLSPQKQMAYAGLIQLYLSTQRFDLAHQYAEKMYKLDTEFPDGQVFYAVAAIYANKLTEADEVIKNSPALHDTPFALNVLDAYSVAKQFNRMVPLYEELVSKHPENAQFHASLAAIYAAVGRFDDAARQAREAARLDPENFQKESETFLKQIGR